MRAFGTAASSVRHRPLLAAACALAIVGAALGLASACSSGRPPETSSAVTSQEGEWSGSLVAADTLSNTTIGGPHATVLSFRFRARWTGPVRGVRCHIILNPSGRQGYSGGTGGLLRVALAPDSGGKRRGPRNTPLAATVIRPSRRDLWPLVRFAKPPHVVAGRLYHVVFTNVAPDPRRDYLSINALLSRGHGEPTPHIPAGLAALLGDTSDGGATPTRWRPRAIRAGDRYVPILDVVGDGPRDHLGIGYMEAWVTAPKPIGGAARVRQLLRMPVGGKTEVTGAWLRVWRARRVLSTLELRLQAADGDVLASASVPARKVSRRSPQWVHVRFSSAVSLPAGTPLALTASARQAESFRTFPVRKGTRFGFDRSTVYSGGYAQYSDGDGWKGWEQWGQTDRRDGDLQFALDIRRSSDASDSP
jgi:hypothetical protein